MSICKRIALFSPSMTGGGSERVMLHLSRGFTERGIKVDLVLAHARGSYLKAVPPQVRIVDLRANRVLTSLPRLVRYLRQERPAAMLSTQRHANVISIWAKRLSIVSTRLVVREANVLHPLAVNKAGIRQRFMLYLMRNFYPWADGIVAVSEGVALELTQSARLSREHIQVIYNPVNESELMKKAKEPLNHSWFQPDRPPVILGVGRLVQQKDFYTLISAFSMLRKVRPLKLVILGEGEKRVELEKLVAKLDLTQDVSLPGFVDNPHAYMAHAGVYVLSSRWEGLPNTLLEAMTLGTPVVATDCKSGPSEILEGGKYGSLIPVGDANALATAISKVLEERERPRFSEKMLYKFSLDACIAKYLRLMQCDVKV